jgi:tRNA pseudouridine55 synthase
MDGILLVDKPRGPSSFAAVARVRRLLGVRRVGHAGTLDPLASGLLLVLVGEGVKLSPYLTGLDKEYRATVRLGVTTDTDDAEGRVLRDVEAGHVDPAQVEHALDALVGAIQQRPPAFSAIKQDGQRLYRRARAGQAVEVAAREVVIHSILVERCVPPLVEFVVRCSKGTYVRSVARDLGEALGVGGHLAGLRRTRIGPFSVAEAVDPFPAGHLPELVPLLAGLAHLPRIAVDEEGRRRIRWGQQEALEGRIDATTEGPVVVVGPEGELLALAAVVGGKVGLRRVFGVEVARATDAPDPLG